MAAALLQNRLAPGGSDLGRAQCQVDAQVATAAALGDEAPPVGYCEALAPGHSLGEGGMVVDVRDSIPTKVTPVWLLGRRRREVLEQRAREPASRDQLGVTEGAPSRGHRESIGRTPPFDRRMTARRAAFLSKSIAFAELHTIISLAQRCPLRSAREVAATALTVITNSVVPEVWWRVVDSLKVNHREVRPMMKKLLNVTFLVAFGAGCSVSTESPGASEEPSTRTGEERDFEDLGDPDEVFTQTLIVANEDGSIETRSSTITRAEQWEIRRRERELQGRGVDWHSNAAPQHNWRTVAPGPLGVCSGSSLLLLWDEENYVGNQLCFAYQQQWVTSGVPFVPLGLDMSTFARGPTLPGCGAHSWWEAPRSCVYKNGAWQWEYQPLGLVTLQARSAKNNAAVAALFSTHAARNQGTYSTVAAGAQPSSMFLTQRYLKALP
ncbi:MAG: hypothetical protein J0I07_28315 [Myxococcales bacterium]|nr:hypothetical protein [Myxococcales bacterium]